MPGEGGSYLPDAGLHGSWWRGRSPILELEQETAPRLCTRCPCSSPVGSCTSLGAGWLCLLLLALYPQELCKQLLSSWGKWFALGKPLSTLLLKTFLRSILTHAWVHWGGKGFLPSGLEKVMREHLPALAIAVEQNYRAAKREGRTPPRVMRDTPRAWACQVSGPPRTWTPGVPTANLVLFPSCTIFKQVFKKNLILTVWLFYLEGALVQEFVLFAFFQSK